MECSQASCEGCPMNCGNLTEVQKKELAKKMLQIALSRMTPEQRKVFFKKIQMMAYQKEIAKKMSKHKKLIGFLSMPIFPITFLISISKAYRLKKQYLKQVEALAKNLKMLNELTKKPRNIISPERKRTEKKSEQKTYVS